MRHRHSITGVLTLIPILLAVLFGLICPVASADPGSRGPFDPSFNGGQPLKLSSKRIVFSSPTLADLDGDRRPDILVGGSDGMVYAIRSTGALLWSYQVAQATNPLAVHPTSVSVIRSAISVGDINNDGYPEVVVGVGDICSADQLPGGYDSNGGLVVLDHNGVPVKGWPALTRDQWGCDGDGYTDAIAASPALGDLDGDGDLEIVALSFDQRIYVWHHDGTPMRGWPQFVREGQWSPAALADLDHDGNLEIVTLISTHYEPGFGTRDGGELRIYRAAGELVCRYAIDQSFSSAPAIGDLDRDGELEIVAGTGEWFTEPGRGWQVYAWDGNCRNRPGWPVSTQSNMAAAPALADLDGDGKLEVIATSGTLKTPQADPRIYAWHYDGRTVAGFPSIPVSYNGTLAYPVMSPIVADWNGDGLPEIFTDMAWEVGVVRSDGSQYSYWPGGPASNKTYWGRYSLNNTSALGDLDNDGKLELVVASVFAEGDPSQGGILVYEAPIAGGHVEWPMLGADARHTHVYPRAMTDDARIASHTIPGVMAPESAYSTYVEVQNTGTSTWTASAGYQLRAVSGADPLQTVSAIPLAAGQAVPPGGTVRFQVPLRAPDAQGYYQTEWRMSRGTSWFGTKVQTRVKVGNDPALYVLLRDGSLSADRTGIFPVGIAQSIAPPADAAVWFQLQNWKRAVGFDVLPDASGYHVVTKEGITTWSASTPELGRLPFSANGAWVGFDLAPDGTEFFGLDRNGQLYRTDGLSVSVPGGLPSGQYQDLVVTPDNRGLLIMDRQGRVSPGEIVRYLPSPPSGLPFPKEQAIARKIKITSSGRGYYILDDYGRLWGTGDAQPLTANYPFHIGEDWARDFALTEDGKGYYLLDREGRIYTGGDAVAPTLKLPPVCTGCDIGAELSLSDSRTTANALVSDTPAIFCLTERGQVCSRTITLSKVGSAISWTAVTDADWLRITPSTGSTPAQIMISADTTRVPPGRDEVDDVIVFKSAAGEALLTLNVHVRLADHLHRGYLPLVWR